MSTLFLPTISAVDEADELACTLMSSLDQLAAAAERFAGDDVPRNESGIPLEEPPPRHVDPAVVARLLVFSNQLEGDIDTIGEYTERLRDALLRAYVELVRESSPHRETDAAS